MKISFSKIELPPSGAIVVGVYDERKLTPTAAQLDKQSKGAIERALGASRFKGKPDDILTVLAPSGLEASRIVLVGLGKPGTLDTAGVQAIGGRLAARPAHRGEAAPPPPGRHGPAPQAAAARHAPPPPHPPRP